MRISGLLYAINRQGQLVHIDSVPNGLACECRCPGCGEVLIAKNNGETMIPHFAHYYGSQCAGGHETELHLLGKEIIAEERSVMLPSYGSVYKGGLQTFERVEIENHDNKLNLTPDIRGIAKGKNGNESHLWIEIKVNHAIGFEKRRIIQEHNIACIEIDLRRFLDKMVTKEELRSFLLHSSEDREWTNNPVLEAKQRNKAEEKRNIAQKLSNYQKPEYDDEVSELQNQISVARNQYLGSHPNECLVPASRCHTCKHHTIRQIIHDEITRRHLPAWLKEALDCNLLWLTKDNINSIVCYDKCYCIRYQGYSRFLPTSSPDVFGRFVNEREIRQNKLIIPFLLNTVPDIIAANTLRCDHNRCSLPSTQAKYDIACDFPKVVNIHRKKRKQY